MNRLEKLTEKLLESYDIITLQGLLVRDYPLENAVHIYPQKGKIEEVRYKSFPGKGKLAMSDKDGLSFYIGETLYIISFNQSQ